MNEPINRYGNRQNPLAWVAGTMIALAILGGLVLASRVESPQVAARDEAVRPAPETPGGAVMVPPPGGAPRQPPG